MEFTGVAMLSEQAMHQVLELVSRFCAMESLVRLATCNKQFRNQVQGELVQQHLLRLFPEALYLPQHTQKRRTFGASRAVEPQQTSVRMHWLCKAAGGECIKAHAAALGAACIQEQNLDVLAADELAAAGLEIPYADVLAAAPRAALVRKDRPCYHAALWIDKGLVPDAPELARFVCQPQPWSEQVSTTVPAAAYASTQALIVTLAIMCQ
jgi:hypothetical protein